MTRITNPSGDLNSPWILLLKRAKHQVIEKKNKKKIFPGPRPASLLVMMFRSCRPWSPVPTKIKPASGPQEMTGAEQEVESLTLSGPLTDGWEAQAQRGATTAHQGDKRELDIPKLSTGGSTVQVSVSPQPFHFLRYWMERKFQRMRNVLRFLLRGAPCDRVRNPPSVDLLLGI